MFSTENKIVNKMEEDRTGASSLCLVDGTDALMNRNKFLPRLVKLHTFRMHWIHWFWTDFQRASMSFFPRERPNH